MLIFALETICLHITDKNNLSGFGHARVINREELSTEEIYRLLNESLDLGTKYLMIDGGEPLMRDDIFDILNYASDIGLSMEIYTNGILITPEVAKKLYDAGVNSVLFNMDYADKGRFDWHNRAEGSYEKAISGMRALRKYPIIIGINTNVTPDNINELDSLMDIALEEGMTMIRFVPLVSDSSNGSKVTALSQHDWANIASEVIKCADKHIDDIIYADYRILPESANSVDFFALSCNAGISWINILPDGGIKACPFLPAEKANLKESSIKDIWLNNFGAFRTIKSESLGGRCKNCAYVNCKGGCIAERMSNGGINGAQKICIQDVLKEGITDFNTYNMRKMASGWYDLLYMKSQCCVRNLPIWSYPLKLSEKQAKKLVR